MPIPRIATLLGGLLLSRGGRRVAGRHAGKLTMATLAWQLYQAYRANKAPLTPGTRQQQQEPPQTPHNRRRWSGRRV